MLKTKKVIKPMMLACSAGLLLTACATYEDDTAYSETSMETSSINEGSGAQQGWQSGAASRSQDYSASQQQSYSSQSSQSQLQSGNELVIPLHEEQVNVGKRTVDAGTVTIRKVVTTETVSQPVQLRRETLVIDREGGSNASIQSSASTSQSQRSQSESRTQTTADVDTDADADADISAQASTSGAGVQAQADFDAAEPAGAQQQSSSTQHQTTRSSNSQSQNISSSGDGNAFQEQTYTIQLREEQPVVEKSVVQTGQVVARKNAQTQRQNVQREIRREDVQIDRGANARNVEIRGNFDSASGSISEPSGAERRSADQESSSSVERSSTYQSETQVETDVDAGRIGVQGDDQFEDSRTLDDINQGSNTRGGAEDLQRFDEKANP